MKELIAKDGYYYTDGEMYAKNVLLGVNDSESRWYLIKEENVPQKEECTTA